MLELVISLLLPWILSQAEPEKAKARQFLKDKLSGWKERAALAVFDAAWEIAVRSAQSKKVAVTLEQAHELADLRVAIEREALA